MVRRKPNPSHERNVGEAVTCSSQGASSTKRPEAKDLAEDRARNRSSLRQGRGVKDLDSRKIFCHTSCLAYLGGTEAVLRPFADAGPCVAPRLENHGKSIYQP